MWNRNRNCRCGQRRRCRRWRLWDRLYNRFASVRLSVCEHSHGSISWSIFIKIGKDVTPKRKSEFVKGQYCTTPSLFCHRKPPFWAKRSWKTMQILKSYICLKCTRIAEIFASLRKSASRNTTVTSDFRPEVEMWSFHACAMHPSIIIGTVRSLWTRLWGRYQYHVPQNAFICRQSFSSDLKSNLRNCWMVYIKIYDMIYPGDRRVRSTDIIVQLSLSNTNSMEIWENVRNGRKYRFVVNFLTRSGLFSYMFHIKIWKHK